MLYLKIILQKFLTLNKKLLFSCKFCEIHGKNENEEKHDNSLGHYERTKIHLRYESGALEYF